MSATCIQCKPKADPYESVIDLCYRHAAVDALEEALNSLLDGLEANYVEEGSGLTSEEWDKRVKKAREVSDLAAAKGGKEMT